MEIPGQISAEIDTEASIALHSDAGAPLLLTFCGSKAGATFCLAMISISSGLKTRASQRCRNNCLTLEMENGALANFLGERDPPPCCAPGAGGCGAISGLKTELQSQFVVIACENDEGN
jgi:hypothetical protein